ncbi:hypothetical protein B0O40_1797 [Ruminococcaceae bacterium R-25]|nr:hypothetical protein B0O40_1797 [Ruminococcaceae bacterium R-25]SUQ21661.1 hypothetical protein SAMN06297423_1797 [Oscillospiraceae bacterium]
MRVYINKANEQRPTLIEVIQVLQHIDDYVAFIIPASEYSKGFGYTRYLSTTPVDKAQFERWCSTLLRSGYLDCTNTGIFFESRSNPKAN